MGVLASGTLSYGIEVITPEVVARPDMSSECPISTEYTDALEYLDERDPDELPGGAAGVSRAASYRSFGRSLCSFLPKNDFPPDDCRDLSDGAEVGGILLIAVPQVRITL